MNDQVKSDQAANPELSWEFQEKTTTQFSQKWYLGMTLSFLVLMSLAILVIKSWSFALLLVVLAISLVIYLKRPARTLRYQLAKDSVFIDDRAYSLADFKSFGVLQQGQAASLILIPIKRFSPSVTLDFPQEQGEAIVDFFGQRLPMQDIQPNFIDSIINRLGL